MITNLKPEGTSWKDWLNTMKNGKLLLTNINKRGLSNFDPNMLKTVDLDRNF